MRALIALGFLLAASCAQKESPALSYASSEADEYGVYQAIIAISPGRDLGGRVEVEPETSSMEVDRLQSLSSIEGFDPVALTALRRDASTPRRLEVSRLNQVHSTDSFAQRYTFSRIGFDARGITAVAAASTRDSANLYALARTVDGRWAVTRIRLLWIS